jgi:HEPN domain-containing protein
MFRKGMEDLAVLEPILRTKRIGDEIFGFHAQQAVEKFLKAWLWTLGVSPPKKHDLRLLCLMVSNAGASLPQQFTDLMDLTDFATVFRYEIYEERSELDKQMILSKAQVCADHVRPLVYGAP